MFFEASPDSILSELGVQCPKRSGPSVIDFSMENTVPRNKSVTYSTPVQPAVLKLTSQRSWPCKNDISAVDKRSCEERKVAARASFDVKNEDILIETALVATTSLHKAVTKAIAVVLEAI